MFADAMHWYCPLSGISQCVSRNSICGHVILRSCPNVSFGAGKYKEHTLSQPSFHFGPCMIATGTHLTWWRAYLEDKMPPGLWWVTQKKERPAFWTAHLVLYRFSVCQGTLPFSLLLWNSVVLEQKHRNGQMGSNQWSIESPVCHLTVASSSCFRGRLKKPVEGSYGITNPQGTFLPISC